MAYENVLLEKQNHVGILTLNRPPANAINLGLLQDLEKVLDELEADRDVRVVIVTGAGSICFSAGFDIKDAANSDKTSPLGVALFNRIEMFSKPVIAAINGHALGGGCELAMACYYRIMIDAPKASIGLTELNLGIIPGWGGTQRMPRIIGKSKALDLILFSKRLTAPQALEIGLIDKVSAPDNLMQDALDHANGLAKRAPIAISSVLKAVNTGLNKGLEQGLKAEAEGSRAVSKSKDAAEGFAAFLQKREPVFTGE